MSKGMVMAKAISVADALAALQASGVELTDEQTTALEEFKSKSLKAEAEKIVSRKLTEEKPSKATVQKYTTDLFTLAEKVHDTITSDVRPKRGQGVGNNVVRMIGIDTPHGHLKIELTVPE